MKIKEKLSQIINKAEDILFPNYQCPFCKTETPDGVVCENCNKLRIAPNYCIKCGAHVGADSAVCIQCKDYERIFDQSFSVFAYSGKVASAVQRLKFNSEKFLAKDFANLLAQKFKEVAASVDFVTFVPSTKKRIKERGYNQAQEIANEFAKLVNIPCLEVLTKTKETAHQTELSRKERLENIIGSIAVLDKWQVKGKNALVIDDVFTTGSTISACAKALKKAGAAKVYGLTLAKTNINV